ncbi:MAG TPA: Gfo/Idh/MocA family oxidoreductase [Capsulimonadaceae bacterium]
MSKLTTAFIGVAHIHTPGFINMLKKRADEVAVKYVYDIDPERGAMRAAEVGGAFADVKTILADPQVTSVIICSETCQHVDLVADCAAAGKHIFCEKPLGLGAADANAIADAIEKAGVIFQTGFFSRGFPVHQFIKQEVAAGHLGKVTRVRYSNCHQGLLAGWFATEWKWITDAKLAGGGAMLDLGAHHLDLILTTLTPTEGEVVSVAASLGNATGIAGPEIDEYGTALLTFASGAVATLEGSWVDPKLHSGIDVFGTKGQIQIVDGKLRYYSELVEGATGEEFVTDLPEGAPHAFDLFWDAQQGRKLQVPLVPVREAALGAATMERIYNAAGRKTTA